MKDKKVINKGLIRDKSILSISVRNLVEFVMQSGDIVSGFSGSSRMLEGTKVHQNIQKSSDENYTAEVSLSFQVEAENIILEITGRADGIILKEGKVTIDEIKTTSAPLKLIDENFNLVHQAQAKCYAYIYGKQNNIDVLNVRLTYYQIDSDEIKYLEWEYNIKELEDFFYSLIDTYLTWADILQKWINIRNDTINKISFPFPSYRKGQREFAVAVFRAIRDENIVFAEAPTGIGKTIASIFPSIKALGEGTITKIFYLTAKTITRTVAEKAIDMMRSSGLKLKVVTITAKEKICFKEKVNCNPLECEYAKGHFDRIRGAIEDIFKEESFTRAKIEEYAALHRVCPFEFSLDLALFSDCIICDYNYLFDPSVYLKRFFMEGKGDYVFLIDEAHNLVDRGREMYSAQLLKSEVMDIKKAVKGKHEGLYKTSRAVNAFMIDIRKKLEIEEERKGKVEDKLPKELCKLLRKFVREADDVLSHNKNFEAYDELLEFFFIANNFIKISEFYNEKYCTYYEKASSDIRVKMYCIDPSEVIRQSLLKGRASAIFSATLSPMDYYTETLGGDSLSKKIKLPSPFPKENIKVLIDNKVATRYSVRELTYDRVADDIEVLVKSKIGNYLAYFPSYKYLNEVFERFCEKNPDIKVIHQTNSMTESDREEFLAQFCANPKETLVGFAVMGGIFGEGIDLTGDKLSGAAIVGVGLPQVCFEREIMQNYFNETKDKGFEYAYIYPGMNKVMQSVGRVIRTEKDRGVILLIDERFTYNQYRSLLPQQWQPFKIVKNKYDIEKSILGFW